MAIKIMKKVPRIMNKLEFKTHNHYTLQHCYESVIIPLRHHTRLRKLKWDYAYSKFCKSFHFPKFLKQLFPSTKQQKCSLNSKQKWASLLFLHQLKTKKMQITFDKLIKTLTQKRKRRNTNHARICDQSKV